ncbi:MAG: class F sortase [Chloroflexota bacterium]|nr:class F sortase [Chloroflexota bacterium]
MAILLITVALVGCENKETGQPLAGTAPSPVISPLVLPATTTIQLATIEPTPTLFVPGPLFDANLELHAEPEAVPVELRIPALEVTAPILGVGLTAGNVMDAPKGPIGDPLWRSAFWYRGSGIPGESGIATIAAHVNDPLGRPEIFANLKDLQPGDLIIIHVNNTEIDMRFIVDQVVAYSTRESSDPTVLAQIYGVGPVNGTGPQPSPDGLSHLTLITCAGYIVDGEFDHHIVVYATRRQ